MLDELTHLSFRGCLTRLLSDQLIRASSVMFLSTVGGGVLGYVFQVLMGRMLSVEDYGVYITLMAMVTVIGVPLSTLSMLVTRRISAYRATNELIDAAGMYWWVNQKVLWTMLGFVFCILPFAPWLGDYFHLENSIPILLLLSLVFAMAFAPVNVAYLQALQKFNWLAANALASHIFKIGLCAILISAGFKLNGALAGTVLAAFASWLLTYMPIRCIIRPSTSFKRGGQRILFSGVIPVLIANLAFVIMTQLDIVLVNHYYNNYDAGVYAAAAILGKAVMYLPAAVAIALFPLVAEKEALNQGSARLFFNAMFLTIILSGAAALFYFLFANSIVTLFYGQKYHGAAELLRFYGFAIMPMALIMVAEHFLIAKGRIVFAYVMMAGIPFVLMAVHAYHNSLMNMVVILAVCGWGLVIAGFGFIGGLYWRGIQKKHDK